MPIADLNDRLRATPRPLAIGAATIAALVLGSLLFGHTSEPPPVTPADGARAQTVEALQRDQRAALAQIQPALVAAEGRISELQAAVQALAAARKAEDTRHREHTIRADTLAGELAKVQTDVNAHADALQRLDQTLARQAAQLAALSAPAHTERLSTLDRDLQRTQVASDSLAVEVSALKADLGRQHTDLDAVIAWAQRSAAASRPPAMGETGGAVTGIRDQPAPPTAPAAPKILPFAVVALDRRDGAYTVTIAAPDPSADGRRRTAQLNRGEAFEGWTFAAIDPAARRVTFRHSSGASLEARVGASP